MPLAYLSELTAAQWELLESQLPAPSSLGRPCNVNLRKVVQAILYVLMSDCAGSLLPQEYPPYSTVYYYFHKWRQD